MLVSVDDIAASLGMNMKSLWVIPRLSDGISYLKRIGASAGPIVPVSTAKDIAKLVPFDGSVVMIAVRVLRPGRQPSGHAIYAYRTVTGQMRYMDRSVNASRDVFRSIEEIAPLYGKSASLVPFEAALLRNIFVKSIAHEVPRLLIPVLGVIASEG